jgi:DNA-binding HxlR family transcriptional regulator
MPKKRVTSGSYGQYCPLALAAELLCRRWTVLVISRLIDGCTTFTEIHQGVPRISPTLLSTRLEELEDVGILIRKKISKSTRYRYELTQAGWDLEDIIMKLAIWGQHWARDMDISDLDPGFLAWSMHTRINTKAMPSARIVMHFEFSGAPADCQRFWLVHDKGKVDMCLKNPGFETDLLIKADLRNFIETWRGFRDLRQEIRAGRIKLTGPSEHKKAFPTWLLLSALSPYPRKVQGRERRIHQQMAG